MLLTNVYSCSSLMSWKNKVVDAELCVREDVEDIPMVQHALAGCSVRLLLIIILVKLFAFHPRTYTRKCTELKAARAMASWRQISASSLYLHGKAVVLIQFSRRSQSVRKSVFELDASTDNGLEIKENRLPSRARATKCRL